MSAPGATATSSTETARLLLRGEVTVKGRMPWSSNATFLVEVTHAGETTLAVYKPERGERPLWDFPRGLFKRELAAWYLSEALRWGVVPLTVHRDGPYGEGSLQLFIQADFEQHYFTLHEDPAHRARFQRICLFDLIANNADRKSGHCLLGPDGIYAVDNGLCFHVEPKLRTVIWEFGGTPIPPEMRSDIRRFARGAMPKEIAALLEPDEQKALRARAAALATSDCFPVDSSGHRYPWPPV
jgi:uncharacterized repeat protein (TIGR03843 family)